MQQRQQQGRRKVALPKLKKKNISTHLFGVFWQWGQLAQQTAPTAGRIDEVHFHLFTGGVKKWERDITREKKRPDK
jgi:hypothetical protein